MSTRNGAGTAASNDLDGRVAIVTGAGAQGEGIGNGRAAAALLGRAGAKVVLVDLNRDRLTATEDLLRDNGSDFISIVADVSTEAGCRGIVESAISQWGRLDVLVNNVGVVGPAESVVDIDPVAWDDLFRVNVTSVMLMSKFSIPHMRTGHGGSIVNVSSLAGSLTHPRPAYATTKGAILSLTRSMASRHGPEGIRVNAIAPGTVYTPMVQAEGLSEDARAARAAILPLRTEGTGWDVGEAVLYLAGPRSRWVTGITLTVDGGFSADLRMSNAATVTPG
ncbi:SDR family oxidoreductase [Mycolicibacterium porcinum]|uniref:SDR family NAD(P)-dependent oxidoreductase n=1 Tax=Mycolicibacterium porcinum TaxID=39693 RepID=UPI0011968926|nr:SDR family oxidoreductase [Mycolicibacterium porcinum]TVX98928.1 SDR family oxidoreductase [Mycolicibacterium porcinum]